MLDLIGGFRERAAREVLADTAMADRESGRGRPDTAGRTKCPDAESKSIRAQASRGRRV